MKKLKISFVGVLAIAIAMMASSFTLKRDLKKESGVWFTYNGTGQKNIAGSYDLQGDDPMCANTESLCAIRATDVDGHPDNTELQALYSNGDLDQPGNGDVEFGDIP